MRAVLTVHGALNSRTTLGGTAPTLVATQIKQAQIVNAETEQKITSKMQTFSEMMSA